MPYTIEYSPDAEDHLWPLMARQRSIVLDSVDSQLAHQPGVETRNRKPIRPNPVVPWELHIGDLRAYYDIVEEPEKRVLVRAVGIKIRSSVRIGGEEVQL
ncbi:type II toxin-antitoxin system RelE family toxin [Candidatus Thiosymbion oneisti]|uniref:type II toxin-antitoxin system RelE family toxin n=1 Tax=Candidatus Thiosymbion oneisti TaxID=589554 RepID=UPI00114D2541|nr:type II toxin-antitoxin system RelE/ParE family toxin [Candidatus Thiosymbion oneisti]